MNFSNSSNQTNLTNPGKAEPVIPVDKVIVYTVLMLCSLVGNISLIAVIFRDKTLKTNFNFVVVNMAVSDLFVPILVIPYELSNALRLSEEWPVDGDLGSLMCKLYWFAVDLSHAVSIFSLLVIAANRFVAIVYPFSIGLSNSMDKKNKYFIALTWLLAIAVFSAHFESFKLFKNSNGSVSCFLDTSDVNSLRIQYGFVVFVTFFIPFFIIAILYLIMLFKLYFKSKHVETFMNDKQFRCRQRRNKQIFFLSIAIILSCMFMVGPLFCYLFVINFIWNWDFDKNFKLHFFVLHCIYFAYTSSNPLIYFIFVKSYRHGLQRLYSGKRRNTRRESSSNFQLTTRFSKQSLTSSNTGERIELACVE